MDLQTIALQWALQGLSAEGTSTIAIITVLALVYGLKRPDGG